MLGMNSLVDFVVEAKSNNSKYAQPLKKIFKKIKTAPSFSLLNPSKLSTYLHD